MAIYDAISSKLAMAVYDAIKRGDNNYFFPHMQVKRTVSVLAVVPISACVLVK